MKKANFYFNLLFWVGIILLFGAFMVFVPNEMRSNKVVWLDFAIVLVLYTGVFGRYTVLFRPLTSFADRVPLIAAYWKYFSSYATLSIGGMIIMWHNDVVFEKQLLIQVAFLFLFSLGLALGFWMSEWHVRSSVIEQRTMSKIRQIQLACADVQVQLSRASDQFCGCRNICEELADELNSIPGLDAPAAYEIEEKILSGLNALKATDFQNADPDIIAAQLHALGLDAVRRKTLR